MKNFNAIFYRRIIDVATSTVKTVLIISIHYSNIFTSINTSNLIIKKKYFKYVMMSPPPPKIRS